MKVYRFALVVVLVLAMAAPVLAAEQHRGIYQLTVYHKNNAALPEISVRLQTAESFATPEQARNAAESLKDTAMERAASEAVEFWGQVRDEQIGISAENCYTRTAEITIRGVEVLYRGLVAQGFMFEQGKETKLVYHSEVTKTFKSYDEAYQAARALAAICKKNGIEKIVREYGVMASAVRMVSVKFDVDLTDKDEPNYRPRYRGIVIHGFSFPHAGTDKFVQKAGLTGIFASYDEAMKAARAMTESNFKQGKAEIAAEFGVPYEKIVLLSVNYDIDLL